ncbi:MAG TPA: 50S ribosomal protein L10 [Actinomycetota bacterium]|jgi:large subunit ribosomal protein L10|nr:50S ribosomal protein L10 [Actinomycetota bacterium]
MKRAEKVDSVQELQNDLGRATVTVLAEYRGLTVTQMNRFRRAVRDADGRCRVAKNTLAKRAVTSSRYERLTPLLRGPMALIIGFKDPVAIAKLAVKFAEELPKLEIKGAVLDGQVLPPAEVKALATLPSREVVMAQLLGLLQAPATQLLRTLNEPAARVARLVDALGKRRESAEGGAAS